MAGRVKEHPECGPRLVLRLACPQRKGHLLALVQVLHHQVKVHLLGNRLPRPFRRVIRLDLLESNAIVPIAGTNLEPIGLALHVPAQQFAIKGGKGGRIRTINNNTRVSGNCHVYYTSSAVFFIRASALLVPLWVRT